MDRPLATSQAISEVLPEIDMTAQPNSLMAMYSQNNEADEIVDVDEAINGTDYNGIDYNRSDSYNARNPDSYPTSAPDSSYLDTQVCNR